MATMSIGKAWEEAVAFVARESTLLLPVALLFLAVPVLLLQEMTPPELAAWSANPNRTGMPPVPGSYWITLLITVVAIWFGSLALFALALRPGISVGEALRLSGRRLPVLLGTAFLVGAAFMAVIFVTAMVVGIAAALSKGAAALIGGLLFAGVGAAMLFAAVRFLLINPVVIDGTDGVIASLRQCWALTRGHFWRLLAFMIVVLLLSVVLASAAQAVFGLIAGLIAGADAARLVGGIAGAAVSTVVQVYMLVMLARLYRQAAAKDVGGAFR